MDESDIDRAVEDHISQQVESYISQQFEDFVRENESVASEIDRPDNLAEWVRSGRESLRWSQSKLSNALGITVVQVRKIENGRAETSLATLRKMCRIFAKKFVVGQDRDLERDPDAIV